MTLIEFANIFIPLTVFLLMICLGMELAIEDFRRVITYPKAVAVGITGQMLLMPAMAFAVAAMWPGSLEFQVGLILLAACPGGPLSNSFVYVARARVDLSVSLTAINGLLALISTPLIASLGIRLFAGAETDIELPVLKTMGQIFALAILPVIIGMTLKARVPAWVARNDWLARRFAIAFLMSHIVLVLALNADRILSGFAEMLPPALCFAILAQGIGYVSAKLMGLDRDTCFTIGVEVGLQNVVLAILIANLLLERPEFSLFVVIYAASILLLIVPWIFIHRWVANRAATADTRLHAGAD
ncbi:MAG: bile acid:sodium symporter [Gammaproteobacteria bacterium]|nr:bile acid:sodium symporter [Gammaproteobacteria bacterium]